MCKCTVQSIYNPLYYFDGLYEIKELISKMLQFLSHLKLIVQVCHILSYSISILVFSSRMTHEIMITAF